MLVQYVLILLGFALLYYGAEWLVKGSASLARSLGVTPIVIGLTVVAFGTSLPELATSVVAALKKQMDISIGNLVGSNVFNILMVVGAASAVRPIPIPGGFFDSGLIIDYGVMMLTSLLPWVMMRKKFTVSRKSGFLLLCCYAGYIAYLIVKA